MGLKKGGGRKGVKCNRVDVEGAQGDMIGLEGSMDGVGQGEGSYGFNTIALERGTCRVGRE